MKDARVEKAISEAKSAHGYLYAQARKAANLAEENHKLRTELSELRKNYETRKKGQLEALFVESITEPLFRGPAAAVYLTEKENARLRVRIKSLEDQVRGQELVIEALRSERR